MCKVFGWPGFELHTRYHDLRKIVTMSGQCVIGQVNVPGLGYNWTTFYTLAAVTTGWGLIQHIFSWTIKVADNWLNVLWFFCVLTCSTTLLGGGIFQTVKSCIITTVQWFGFYWPCILVLGDTHFGQYQYRWCDDTFWYRDTRKYRDTAAILKKCVHHFY